MNERIQQLVESAPYTTISTEGRLFSQQDLAVFAELIVKECLGAISGKEIFKDETEYEQGYNKALKSVYSDLVEKFGVEE
jgi:hypothetical protein